MSARNVPKPAMNSGRHPRRLSLRGGNSDRHSRPPDQEDRATVNQDDDPRHQVQDWKAHPSEAQHLQGQAAPMWNPHAMPHPYGPFYSTGNPSTQPEPHFPDYPDSGQNASSAGYGWHGPPAHVQVESPNSDHYWRVPSPAQHHYSERGPPGPYPASRSDRPFAPAQYSHNDGAGMDCYTSQTPHLQYPRHPYPGDRSMSHPPSFPMHPEQVDAVNAPVMWDRRHSAKDYGQARTPYDRPPSTARARPWTKSVHCASCGTNETPEWRKGPMGPRTLCNACGLIWAKLLKRKREGQSSSRQPDMAIAENLERLNDMVHTRSIINYHGQASGHDSADRDTARATLHPVPFNHPRDPDRGPTIPSTRQIKPQFGRPDMFAIGRTYSAPGEVPTLRSMSNSQSMSSDEVFTPRLTSSIAAPVTLPQKETKTSKLSILNLIEEIGDQNPQPRRFSE